MQNELLFALISAAFYIVWAVPYMIGIWKKEVVPHPFSYGTWLILVGVNIGILYQTNSGWSMLPAWLQFVSIIFYTIGGLVMFKRIKTSGFDYLCLSLAFVSIIIWYYSSNEVAAALTALIDFIAFLPTFKKWWLQPETEYVFPWLMAASFPLFLIFASNERTFANAAFWMYLVVACGGFTVMLWWRKRMLAAAEPI